MLGDGLGWRGLGGGGICECLCCLGGGGCCCCWSGSSSVMIAMIDHSPSGSEFGKQAHAQRSSSFIKVGSHQGTASWAWVMGLHFAGSSVDCVVFQSSLTLNFYYF